MDRFNYPDLASVEAEDVRIIQLLEAESYGLRRDQEEEIEEQKQNAELAQMRADHG